MSERRRSRLLSGPRAVGALVLVAVACLCPLWVYRSMDAQASTAAAQRQVGTQLGPLHAHCACLDWERVAFM